VTQPKKSDYGRGAFIAHERVQLTCEKESRAKQSMSAECDINNIMAKYAKQGIITHVNEHQGQYGDLPGVVDYHDALNAVIAAKDAFGSLPSAIRNRFNNEPADFLAFVQDEENEEEMAEMGLIDKPSSRQPLEAAADAEAPPTPAPDASISDAQ
jgi:phage internal scaffolding protein